MKRKTTVKIVRGEKLLYFFILALVICVPLFTVFTKALLSESNIEVEKVKSKIKVQEKTNNSLSMQIDELASLDKIQKIASEKGLYYYNNNIKVISE